jgi:gliding motility-associated-like protein
VFKYIRKAGLLIVISLFYCASAVTQLRVTVPWSSSLNVTFGNGIPNTGPPLPVGYSDFTYTTSPLPGNGSYGVIKSTNDAGHLFFGPFTIPKDPEGYKMIAAYNAAFAPKILFRDTVRGLCGNNKYLFWASITNRNPRSCLLPSLTFSVETTSGAVIDTFLASNIGGNADNTSWYYGYYDAIRKPPVPFYGGIFQLPPGINDIVVKIITNPSTASTFCSTLIEIDNILLTPIGPDITISSPKYPGGWITASCFRGNVPLVMNGKIESGYLAFGTTNYVLQNYINPGFQWQQSLDEGYTWADIPGETNINMTRNFNIADTFWIRLRVSEAADISNPNCSNVSNIFKVEVDSFPKGFSLSSNSPVCTDGDVKFAVSGGASYNTFGPNGFYDNSPFPHIYHPALKDSGWYYTEIISFGGCIGTDSEYVKIIGPDLHVSPGKSICYGDTVHLHATGGTTYTWTPLTGLTNAKISNPVATPLTTTTYEVKVTDNSGCNAYGKVNILLRDSILKAIINGPDVACPNEVILFKDTSLGQIINWHWNFGNGITSNLKNPAIQHYPVTNGTLYPVTLTITDTAGCIQSAKKTIKSVNNCFIAVPNAFTPNNDGLNDFLYPVNAYKATNLLFQVFNRFGSLVFTTNNLINKWDGTIGGIPQDSGVYIWILNYTDADRKKISLKGTAVLIR